MCRTADFGQDTHHTVCVCVCVLQSTFSTDKVEKHFVSAKYVVFIYSRHENERLLYDRLFDQLIVILDT